MNQTKKTIATIIITCLLSTFITYSVTKRFIKSSSSSLANDTTQWVVGKGSCEYKFSRISGYKYIKPLAWVEEDQTSAALENLRNKINAKIEDYKKGGVLISASVYLKIFRKGEWTVINDTETYYPGSLIKVAGLLTYLRMEEVNPGVLNNKITFTDTPSEYIPGQTYNSKQIEFGKTYTVKELLKYMVAYSDNNATYLLNKNVDMKTFEKLFADFNLSLKTNATGTVKMTVRDYSRFINIIYNASYLSLEHSEFAAELLSECDFNEGMVNGLPPNTKLMHKFGEMGDAATRQLHESGIIYLKNTPYLLTIMTKGYDIKKLPAVISDITRITYDEISTNQSFADQVQGSSTGEKVFK